MLSKLLRFSLIFTHHHGGAYSAYERNTTENIHVSYSALGGREDGSAALAPPLHHITALELSAFKFPRPCTVDMAAGEHYHLSLFTFYVGGILIK